ncbi:hypothetical protein [Massilia suwonensis]|uniref:HDOD domain-containing protein n=1 Tax=Massilia suwonensis TaxID=648895 RepID=A0ABW0MQF3_9BURK
MHRFLCSPVQHGSFDFFSNVVVLDKYEEKSKTHLEAALKLNGKTNLEAYQCYSRARSLIMHEAVHFLDVTTTRWGVEYVFRKLRLVEAIQAKCELEDRAKVFMLNTLEIESHTDLLVREIQVGPNDCTKLSHYIKYDKKYGAVLMMAYFYGDSIAYHVPVTMLSVLEANATANEYLQRIYDLKQVSHDEYHDVELKVLRRDFDEAMDKEGLEYSVLIKLCILHFPQLSFQELLEFVSAMARFTLDAGDMLLAALANHVEQSIQSQYGPSIDMELRRGMSRAVIFVKTILLMYGWLQLSLPQNQTRYIDELKRNPSSAINLFLEEALGIDVRLLAMEWTYAASVKMLNEFSTLSDSNIISRSGLINRQVLSAMSPAQAGLQNLMLPDFLLSDDSVLKQINRIDLDVLSDFDKNLKLYSQLDEAYRMQEKMRFHLDPHFALVEVARMHRFS